MNTAKCPPPLISTNALRGALMDSRYCRASQVRVVKDEYQNRELQSEVRRSHRFRLRDEALAAQHLAIAGIIAVLHGIAWSDERGHVGGISSRGLRPSGLRQHRGNDN